jgi:type I pantothenate kinase
MTTPSPYLSFDRQTWRQFRKDTPLTMSEADLKVIKGQNETVSLLEVEEIYLPLSRLLNLYVAATQQLYTVTTKFLGHPEPKVPYIIGVAGSVAVGKSTTSRILQTLLSRWQDHPRVALITTDGFLHSNAVLEQRGLTDRKGFPESYDLPALVNFLADLKAGKQELQVPVYSHHDYDIVPGEFETLQQPDIVIIEGLNVLQIPRKKTLQQPQWFVADFFDFTIYVDAATDVIKQWYIDRFMLFRDKARHDPAAYFHRFAQWDEQRALHFAAEIWTDINERNLIENILPFKQRARLVLEKGQDHAVERVLLRKI